MAEDQEGVPKDVTQWSHGKFVAEVLNAVNKHEIPISDLPVKIDLNGPLGKRCDQLLAETIGDPELRERAVTYVSSTDGKSLHGSKVLTVGEARHVKDRTAVRDLRMSYVNPYGEMVDVSKNEHLVLGLHSHGVADVPASPADLASLVKDPEEGGIQAEIVVTPTQRLLLLRTIETPTLGKDEIVNWVNNRNIQVLNVIEEQVREQVETYRVTKGVTNPLLLKGYADIASRILNPTVQMKLLLEECGKNKIAVYSAGENNVFTRAQ